MGEDQRVMPLSSGRRILLLWEINIQLKVWVVNFDWLSGSFFMLWRSYLVTIAVRKWTFYIINLHHCRHGNNYDMAVLTLRKSDFYLPKEIKKEPGFWKTREIIFYLPKEIKIGVRLRFGNSALYSYVHSSIKSTQVDFKQSQNYSIAWKLVSPIS